MDSRISVFFDFQILLLQKYGGISRYFYEMISRLPDDRIKVKIPVIGSQNYYFQNYLSQRKALSHQYRGMWKLNKMYTHLNLGSLKDVLFHATYYDPYFLSWYKGKLVITIHDMAPELYPDFFENSNDPKRKKAQIERADKIVAVSNSTKEDILRLYPHIDKEKITVVYHGRNEEWDISDDEICVMDTDTVCKYPQKYILYVGLRSKYKNFPRFAKAITRIMENDPDIHLVCVGGGVFNEQELSFFIGCRDRIHQISASDNELRELYRNALCFVFPSIIEGFGIPVLEGLQQGCITVLSDIPVFREIAGEAALYFSPTDELDIADRVYEAVSMNESNRKALIKSGLKRTKIFSWSECAKQHSDIYFELIQ